MPEQVAITLPAEDGRPAANYIVLAELAERCGVAGAGAARRHEPGHAAAGRVAGHDHQADFDYRDSLLHQFPGTFSLREQLEAELAALADRGAGPLS